MPDDTSLHGTVAASVTPLRAGGGGLDEDAFGPLLDRYATAGLDGRSRVRNER